jgi:hypothetical protein
VKLSFRPAPGASPLAPYAPMAVGQPMRLLGQKLDPATGKYVPGEPYACEAGTREADRCVLFFTRGEVVPADDETAKFLGVPVTKSTPSKQDK